MPQNPSKGTTAPQGASPLPRELLAIRVIFLFRQASMPGWRVEKTGCRNGKDL